MECVTQVAFSNHCEPARKIQQNVQPKLLLASIVNVSAYLKGLGADMLEAQVASQRVARGIQLS